MVNVFKVDCQKKMVVGRKHAIRNFRVISIVWFELHCKHSGWRGRGCSPAWGSCQLFWAPGLGGPRRGPQQGGRWAASLGPRLWGLWEALIPNSGFFQQNVPALRKGNINVIIIILCI